MTSADKSLAGKTIVVTGANVGIGKATATALASMGALVAIVARDEAKGKAALADVKAASGSDAVELYLADFGVPASIEAFARDFTRDHDRLDVLVNNAGLMLPTRHTTAEGFESMFAINHLGYFRTTHLLLPLLKKSGPARIVVVASDAHRRGKLELDDLQSERSFSAFGTYGGTKLANILFAAELAERLAGTGITVNSLHPGVVGTDFGQKEAGFLNAAIRLVKPFLLTPEKGAATQIYLASSPEVAGVTGKYFDKKKPVSPSKRAQDVSFRKKLWAATERLAKIDHYGE
jgi:NAD(P)-dependent dehydrogenase (short-subunit alcohol dehydrogenase family)